MIKIVGADSEYIKRTSCRKCASIIEYTLDEVTERKETDYGGGVDIVKELICPCCHNKVTVV